MAPAEGTYLGGVEKLKHLLRGGSCRSIDQSPCVHPLGKEHRSSSLSQSLSAADSCHPSGFRESVGVRSPTVQTFAFAPFFVVLQLGRMDGELECPWRRMGDMPAVSCHVETQTNIITRPSPGLGRSSAEIANVAPFLRDFHLIPCPEVTAFRPHRPRG
ncbi:hypothetical protein CGRA01v4_03763 [Colletotrichum graminicola]|nr:hypothetical protein CGRA01v4_03763 [Colletotrichum graminicola]